MFLNEDKNWLVLWVLVIFVFGYIEIGDINFMDISSGFRNVLEEVDVISIEIFDIGDVYFFWDIFRIIVDVYGVGIFNFGVFGYRNCWGL